MTRSDHEGPLILVTAAGGTVGSAVVTELCAAGHRVRGAYHSIAGANAAAGTDSEAVVVDFAQAATLPRAMDGVDSVFLLTPTGPDQTRQELSIVASAISVGVRRIVKLSVWRADEQLTPIARLHRPVEEALEGSPVAWTFLRPNFYMQNFVRQFATEIRTRGVIAQPESRAAISFVDTRDVARVSSRVLVSDRHVGRIYDITGPQALTYAEVAEVFSTVLERRVQFVALSDRQARAALLERGLSEPYAHALIAVSQAYRDGGAERVSPTVRALTGQDPVGLEQFVRDHRAAFI